MTGGHRVEMPPAVAIGGSVSDRTAFTVTDSAATGDDPRGSGVTGSVAGGDGLPPTGVAVTGSVTSGDGWPLSGVTVPVLGADGGQLGRRATDATGAFAVDLAVDLAVGVTVDPAGPTGPLTLVVAGPGVRPYARTLAADGSRVVDAGRIVLGDRTVADRPPTGRWQIDPAHSIVKATARHLALTRVEGRFPDLAGTIDVAEAMERSRVDVTIDATGLTTGNADRDAHLRSADFLDVERFPALRFRSTGVSRGERGRWRVDGELTIRDITRPVVLDMTYAGSGADPWGGTRAAFTATTQLDRRDYEMEWNIGLPGGLLLVGPTLRIELDVQAVLTV